jgi:hypothetical protein
MSIATCNSGLVLRQPSAIPVPPPRKSCCVPYICLNASSYKHPIQRFLNPARLLLLAHPAVSLIPLCTYDFPAAYTLGTGRDPDTLCLLHDRRMDMVGRFSACWGTIRRVHAAVRPRRGRTSRGRLCIDTWLWIIMERWVCFLTSTGYARGRVSVTTSLTCEVWRAAQGRESGRGADGSVACNTTECILYDDHENGQVSQRW